MKSVFDPAFPRSDEYVVFLNGQEVEVLSARNADFVLFSYTGPTTVEVRSKTTAKEITVRPLSRGITTRMEGTYVKFEMNAPADLWVDFKGNKKLYLFSQQLRVPKPAIDDPNVIYFGAGKIHEAGEIKLKSGQTLFIDHGAIVRGTVRAKDAKNITVCGSGVLDYDDKRDWRWREVLFENCQNITVEGIVLTNMRSWSLAFFDCQNVHVNALREIVFSDGIDICGCSDVVIENTFQNTRDDCIAVKSFNGLNVKNILVSGCALYQDGGGGPMEIGHELRCDRVENITFKNNDVLGAHGFSPVMSIHDADHALVTGVHYEDIRVEHYYNRLIDIRIRDSEYAKDTQRGHITGVTFKNIVVHNLKCNPGYSHSLIGGYDSDHKVKDVNIENLTINGTRITNANDLDIFTKEVENIKVF